MKTLSLVLYRTHCSIRCQSISVHEKTKFSLFFTFSIKTLFSPFLFRWPSRSATRPRLFISRIPELAGRFVFFFVLFWIFVCIFFFFCFVNSMCEFQGEKNSFWKCWFLFKGGIEKKNGSVTRKKRRWTASSATLLFCRNGSTVLRGKKSCSRW